MRKLKAKLVNRADRTLSSLAFKGPECEWACDVSFADIERTKPIEMVFSFSALASAESKGFTIPLRELMAVLGDGLSSALGYGVTVVEFDQLETKAGLRGLARLALA